MCILFVSFSVLAGYLSLRTGSIFNICILQLQKDGLCDCEVLVSSIKKYPDSHMNAMEWDYT